MVLSAIRLISTMLVWTTAYQREGPQRHYKQGQTTPKQANTHFNSPNQSQQINSSEPSMCLRNIQSELRRSSQALSLCLVTSSTMPRKHDDSNGQIKSSWMRFCRSNGHAGVMDKGKILHWWKKLINQYILSTHEHVYLWVDEAEVIKQYSLSQRDTVLPAENTHVHMFIEVCEWRQAGDLNVKLLFPKCIPLHSFLCEGF